MYDPGQGRWLQEDPMGFDAGDSNLYRYVKNSPTNLMDPSGLAPIPQGEWPAWLRSLVGVENGAGERGAISRIIEVNRDFSHPVGANGNPVPAHYDVTYRDESNQTRTQRFRRDALPCGRRAFTEEENASVQQNRETLRTTRRNRRGGNNRSGSIGLGTLGAIALSAAASAVAEYGYNHFLDEGERRGMELARQIGLGRLIQLGGLVGELPMQRSFTITGGDHVINVLLRRGDGSNGGESEQWYITAWHEEVVFSWSLLRSIRISVEDIPMGRIPALHVTGSDQAPIFYP